MRDRFTVFSFLYATAILAHLWNQGQAFLAAMPSPIAIAAWGLLVACLFLLLRPSDGRRLAAVALAHTVYVAIELPYVPSHWVLVTLVNLVLCVGWVRIAVAGSAGTPGDRPGAGRVSAEDVLAWCEPGIRTVVIICYLAAALAKHNSDFLFGANSCGAYLIGLTAQFIPSLDGEGVRVATAWLTMVVETAVPLLLIVPRARWVGLAVGFAFHMMTSFTPGVRVYDFAATLFAVWFLFTPPDALGAVAGRTRAALSGHASTLSAVRLGSVLALGVLIVSGPFLFGHLDTWVRVFGFDFHGALVGVGLIALMRSKRAATPLPGRFRAAHVPVAVFATFIASNPYIGGRSQGAFTMFSNLRTEGGATNHLYIPTLDLLPFQKDLLILRASSDAGLQRRADAGEALVRFEVRRRLHAFEPHPARVSLEWELNGMVERTEDALDDPRFGRPPLVLRKLLVFRPVRVDQPVACGN